MISKTICSVLIFLSSSASFAKSCDDSCHHKKQDWAKIDEANRRAEAILRPLSDPRGNNNSRPVEGDFDEDGNTG